jgi:hypothetical protein
MDLPPPARDHRAALPPLGQSEPGSGGAFASAPAAGPDAIARRFPGRAGALATPRPDEARDIERLAALVVRLVAGDRVPAAWRGPRVAAEVDAVRSHLEPLSSRVLLAFAYDREAERIAQLRALAGDPLHPAPAPSAVDLAYAVRWLELGPLESSLPAWLDLLDAAGLAGDPGATGSGSAVRP